MQFQRLEMHFLGLVRHFYSNKHQIYAPLLYFKVGKWPFHRDHFQFHRDVIGNDLNEIGKKVAKMANVKGE
jgi:hypothetical protein